VSIQNLLLKHLFNAVTEDSFLQILKRKTPQGDIPFDIIVGKESIGEKKIKEYRKQAKVLKDTELYSKILDSMKHTANEQLFKKAVTTDDMIFARAVLYTVDIIEKKVDTISEITIK
jgi:hypothetical protein